MNEKDYAFFFAMMEATAFAAYTKGIEESKNQNPVLTEKHFLMSKAARLTVRTNHVKFTKGK